MSNERERHTQARVRNYTTKDKCSVSGVGSRVPEAGCLQGRQAGSRQAGRSSSRGCGRGAEAGSEGLAPQGSRLRPGAAPRRERKVRCRPWAAQLSFASRHGPAWSLGEAGTASPEGRELELPGAARRGL